MTPALLFPVLILHAPFFSRLGKWIRTWSGVQKKGSRVDDKEKEAEVRKHVIDATYNGIGIVLNDGEGRPLIDANPALVQALDLPPEEVIGAPFFDLIRPTDSGTQIRERMIEGEGWSGELDVEDGKEDRCFRVSIDPIGDPKDPRKVEYFAVICQDITDRKRAEERLLDAIVETQEKERKRMANDLHDGVGQTLTAANVYLKALEKKWRKGEEEKAITHLRTVTDLMAKGIEEVRSVRHDLMPDTLREFGLVRAIRQMIRELDEETTGIRIHFNSYVPSERHRDEALDGAMYRISQEILNNAIKHSGASQLSLQLKEKDGSLMLEASDNGKGLKGSDGDSHTVGSGIEGIQERAASLEGSVEVDSEAGKGTYIRVRLPLERKRTAMNA